MVDRGMSLGGAAEQHEGAAKLLGIVAKPGRWKGQYPTSGGVRGMFRRKRCYGQRFGDEAGLGRKDLTGLRVVAACQNMDDERGKAGCLRRMKQLEGGATGSSYDLGSWLCWVRECASAIIEESLARFARNPQANDEAVLALDLDSKREEKKKSAVRLKPRG